MDWLKRRIEQAGPTLAALAVLAGSGCEPGIVTEEERARSAFDQEQAELAARTGGRPMAGGGYAWWGEEAVLSVTLTENGVPTTIQDIRRMSTLERARANLAAAEMGLNHARKRLANLEGPNPQLSIRTATLAEEIAQTKEVIIDREWKRQRQRNELERMIRWDGTPTLERARANLAIVEAQLDGARKRLADLEGSNTEPIGFWGETMVQELESELRQWQEELNRIIESPL